MVLAKVRGFKLVVTFLLVTVVLAKVRGFKLIFICVFSPGWIEADPSPDQQYWGWRLGSS